MQVILLDKVVNLGGLGDIVKVKDGYARNFLIPTGAARRATASAKAEFEAKRVELEKQAAEKLAAAQQLGEKLNGVNVKLTQKAGVDGRSEEHTSELQSQSNLVCRLLLEKKKNNKMINI